MTEQEANERIALLLGWERREPQSYDRPARMSEPDEQGVSFGSGPSLITMGGEHWGRGEQLSTRTPDYASWDRFQEQLMLVDGLDRETQDRIFDICFPLHESIRRELWRITPTVLRDAILAVVGEEAPA